MSDFKIPPISPLVGSTIINFLKILRTNRVAPEYYHKIFLTALIILFLTPLHWWEKIVFTIRLKNFRIQKAPLFIIGHWRSGTTLLHNILCQDPSSGYLTTYFSLFPNNLSSKWLFRAFIKKNMPSKRPSDNVNLNINFPQEDGFAFSNCQPNGYYNFFYFPSEYNFYYERSIKHNNLNNKEIKNWFYKLDILYKKALIDTGGTQLIVKNPINTARIDKILKLYPDAKFLYIYRNPYSVFFSTQLFFQKLFPTLWLSNVTSEFIDKLILDVYSRLMMDYQHQKSLIPKENLLELKFEKFERAPISEIRKIYSDLLKQDYNKSKKYITKYLKSINGYSKNRYSSDESTITSIKKEWGYFIDLYKYDIPEEVVVK